MWVLAAIELAADAIWPGAEAGGRLLRRVVGGGLVFELVAGDQRLVSRGSSRPSPRAA